MRTAENGKEWQNIAMGGGDSRVLTDVAPPHPKGQRGRRMIFYFKESMFNMLTGSASV